MNGQVDREKATTEKFGTRAWKVEMNDVDLDIRSHIRREGALSDSSCLILPWVRYVAPRGLGCDHCRITARR